DPKEHVYWSIRQHPFNSRFHLKSAAYLSKDWGPPLSVAILNSSSPRKKSMIANMSATKTMKGPAYGTKKPITASTKAVIPIID
ncbi:MAG: hypothetical protein OXE48_03935, partial [Gammaproteobacteria bacterium]|nr:hypothetical protein [Gammaproteobacteria bacterium]